MYRRRLDYVIGRFKAAGLRQACGTEAGIFTLWKVPKKVLGVKLAARAKAKGMQVHEAFNRLVAEKTGIVGLHFQGVPDGGTGSVQDYRPSRGVLGDARGGGEPLIRYAVCADVLDPAFQQRFERQLARLKPEY